MLSNNLLYKILLEYNAIPKDKLDEAVEISRKSNQFLETTVLDQSLLNEDQLSKAVGQHFKIPIINLGQTKIDKKALQVIPEVISRKYHIIAFEQDQNGIKVATCTPENTQIINHLEKRTGLKFQIYYATDKDILDNFKLYKKGLAPTLQQLIPQDAATNAAVAANAPITEIVQKIFEYAIDNRSSDIHIEPTLTNTMIRFRIDGILHDVGILPKSIHDQIISRIKVLAHLRTDEHQVAQDGKLQVIYGTEVRPGNEAVNLQGNGGETPGMGKVDVRVSIAPVINGENVVMRLLSEQNRQFNLNSLGLQDKDLAKIKNEIGKSWGTIIVVGPTGCGKTTTLYSILKLLNKREVNIATIEDPVEYDIEGISQIQVNEQTNLTFANGLRSIVRQDPNIIMVGEIRDKETAAIAINAAMTGHLVLSTLHANDSATTLPRLSQMSIEPYLISSTINLIIAQRIVRKICTKCAYRYQEPIETFKHGFPKRVFDKFFKKDVKTVTLLKGKGCDVCHKSGYTDRIGIFEVMTISPGIEKLIMAKDDATQIEKQAISEGMTTMVEDGLDKVLKGITTISEILSITRE